jgi:NAD(P)-dependent dehydrogenase (short-subunit alcohol dehydrogenase family)
VFSLSNKIALVTGAGSGIGAAIAECFAQAGAKVIVTDRDAAAGQRTAAAISGGEFLELDISDPASVARVAEAVMTRHGRLDILVNNAGIGHAGTLTTTAVEDLDRLYHVNERGTFLVTKAFITRMLERRSGAIVNIVSIGGLIGVRDRLAYTMSKHALAGFTRAVALDHAQDGIRINAICPGRVQTPWIAERLKETPDPEKTYREMCATQPMGRMGKPEEIAAAALYLASDEAAFVTGAMLTPDGGWSAG